MSFREDIFKIPNLLSLSRIVFAPAVFVLFGIPGLEGKIICIVFLGLLFLTDLADGMLARKLGAPSDLGRILDPLADKVLVALLFIALIFYRGLPWWIVLVILARDLAVLAAGLYIKRAKKTVVESNIWGKLSTTFLMLTVLALIVEDFPCVTWSLLGIGLFFLLVSSVTYVAVFFKTMGVKPAFRPAASSRRGKARRSSE